MPKCTPNREKIVVTPCEEKRMRSGADYGTVYNFHGTEQEIYGRRRGRRYIDHTVRRLQLHTSCGHNYSSYHYF